MTCDFCTLKDRWLVYAAYQLDANGLHQKFARYPAPMAKTCDDHLTQFLMKDVLLEFSTKSWVVMPAQ